MSRRSGFKTLRDVKWGHVLEAVACVVCMVAAAVSAGWPVAPWATLAWIGAAVLGAHLGFEFLDSEGCLDDGHPVIGIDVKDEIPLSPAEDVAAEEVEAAIVALLDVLDPEAQWDGVEYQEDEIGNFGRCMLSDDVAREGENGEAVDSE